MDLSEVNPIRSQKGWSWANVLAMRYRKMMKMSSAHGLKGREEAFSGKDPLVSGSLACGEVIATQAVEQ